MPVLGIGENTPRCMGRSRRIGDSLLAAGLLLGLGLVTNRGSAEEAWPPPSPPPLQIELLWNDHYELLKRKLPPAGMEVVEREMTRVFSEIGIGVVWRQGTGTSPPPRGRVVVRIVLMPSPAEGWRLSQDTMGIVMGKELVTRTLFVFFPNVLYGVGDSRGPDARVESPLEMGQVARGLARVVAHEVVHAIDPELPHAEGVGLMNARLTPAMLRREKLSFSEATAKRLRRSLAALASSGPGSLRASAHQ